MSRTSTGFGIAIALGCAVSLGAQTSSTPSQTTSADSRELNVVGCVSRGSDGGFMLTNARVEPATPSATASGSTAGSTTTSGGATTTGTTGTTSTATEPAGSGTSADTTWALKGGSDLEKHVGHKVQITGRAEAHRTETPAATAGSTASSSASAAASGDAHPREIEVQSIKMISTTCS
jgi:hypothetical protein